MLVLRVSDLLSCHQGHIKVLTWPEGGSLGWKTKQPWTLKEEFAKVAFNLEPSSLKNPIIGEAKTDQGYHLIVVTDRR